MKIIKNKDKSLELNFSYQDAFLNQVRFRMPIYKLHGTTYYTILPDGQKTFFDIKNDDLVEVRRQLLNYILT